MPAVSKLPVAAFQPVDAVPTASAMLFATEPVTLAPPLSVVIAASKPSSFALTVVKFW